MNHKEELLTEIQTYKGKVSNFLHLKEELDAYYQKPFSQVSLKLKIFAFIFVWWIGSGILLAIFRLQIIGSLFFVILLFLYFWWPRYQVRQKIAKNSNRIEELRSLIDNLQASINPSLIPKSYIHLHALNKLESYILNKRADDVKEALNLYEEELRHDEQLRELNIVQQMQEATYKKANEATTLGWVNLFRR